VRGVNGSFLHCLGRPEEIGLSHFSRDSMEGYLA